MVGVSSMYVRKHFKKDTKEAVNEIMTYVVDGFKDVLENVSNAFSLNFLWKVL